MVLFKQVTRVSRKRQPNFCCKESSVLPRPAWPEILIDTANPPGGPGDLQRVRNPINRQETCAFPGQEGSPAVIRFLNLKNEAILTFPGMACIWRRWPSPGWRSSQKAVGREGLCRPLLVMLCKGFQGS